MKPNHGATHAPGATRLPLSATAVTWDDRANDDDKTTAVYPTTVRREAPPDPLIGALVGGRHRITGVIGDGAMGVVYAGVQEPLGRPIAIKVQRLGEAWAPDDLASERFAREAQAAASLVHPNAVVVHDFGLLPNGVPYLVMERLHGETFHDLRIRNGGSLDPESVAGLLLPIGGALDALHSKGIVHRDLKPENLILAVTDDGTTVPKLIDFGLVALADKQRLTKKGTLVGTPVFLAPECLLGAALPDRRGDVYSLGIVAFEMLTGATPFQQPTLAGLLQAKLMGQSRTLSQACGRPFPVEIEAVIAKATALRPEERYTSAGEMTRALARVCGATVSLEPKRPASAPRSPPPPAPEHAALDPARAPTVPRPLVAPPTNEPGYPHESTVMRRWRFAPYREPHPPTWRIDRSVLFGAALIVVTTIACSIVIALRFL